ncbi:hypothetical protein [Nocardia flavorosea]|uniref:Uncharacterized protein n=1 Tax=Nocardia flavorosea TaxID=53429 RepID=A0A846YPE7_9NOCA|nr:hypothetical protein [Nocardia flavorosea]NKY60977.1 hypothetical protein [Nocardia flavorosea]
MTTPTPRPNTPGAARVPLPGQHLPGAAGHGDLADPDKIRTEVRELLAELAGRPAGGAPGDESAGTDLARRAHILEQAHEVLVQALATVDKI